jgi:hypothetical protein
MKGSPVRFPDEMQKLHDEAEAFRRLPPSDRFLVIVDLIASGERLMAESPHREFARKLKQQQEEQWHKIQRELFVRYGQ